MAKYKIAIDCETCIGDQLCCEEAPKTFDMNDDNKAVVVNPDGDDAEYILNAAKNCPVDAISLIDVATEEKVWPK